MQRTEQNESKGCTFVLDVDVLITLKCADRNSPVSSPARSREYVLPAGLLSLRCALPLIRPAAPDCCPARGCILASLGIDKPKCTDDRLDTPVVCSASKAAASWIVPLLGETFVDAEMV